MECPQSTPSKTSCNWKTKCDDRTTINAIIFVLITGCRWIDLPAKYGSKSSAHRRFQYLQQKGIWKKILKSAIKSARKQDKINLRYISVDSSSIPSKKGGDEIGYDGFKRITGTKLHVAVESNGLPVSIVTGPANVHDSTRFIDVMESISDFVGNGSIKQIISCFADKGYDSTAIREYLKNREIVSRIPFRKNGKSPKIKSYKKYNAVRYVVERFFAWLKNGFHRTRIRYEKNCDNYLGFVYQASIVMYWRVLG